MVKAYPKPPTIMLKAGETTYELSNTLNAWCDIETAFDLGINQIIQKFGDTDHLRVGDVRTYLKVTMRDAKGEKLNADLASGICDILGMAECSKAVTDHILLTVESFKS